MGGGRTGEDRGAGAFGGGVDGAAGGGAAGGAVRKGGEGCGKDAGGWGECDGVGGGAGAGGGGGWGYGRVEVALMGEAPGGGRLRFGAEGVLKGN